MKKNFINLFSVVGSSFILLLSGIVNNLIIPKIMGVDNYGIYKIFILYGTYISLSHLGIVDGILLEYGGKKVNDLDIIKIRSYARLVLRFSVLFMLLLFLIGLLFLDGSAKWICIFLGVQVIIINAFYFYQYLSQALMKFQLFSFLNIIQSSLTVVIAFILLMMKKSRYFDSLSYKYYIAIYLGIYLIVLFFYIHKLRKFLFGNVLKFHDIYQDVLQLIKIGFPVTISYQIATLIFNLDNQFISMLFSTITFGLYSFSYSLVSAVTTILNSISTVFFPSLNKLNKETALKQYSPNLSYMLILVYFMVLCYYPAEVIVRNFLPAYVGSLIYFRIVIPGVGISTCISLIIFNYFKMLKKGNIYLELGCIVLVFAVLLNTGVYLAFRSSVYIAAASIVILVFWYLILNLYFVVKHQVTFIKNATYMIAMVIIFEIASNCIHVLWASAVVYILLYLLVTFMFYRCLFSKLLSNIVQVKNETSR